MSRVALAVVGCCRGASFIGHIVDVAIGVSRPGLPFGLQVLKPLVDPPGELVKLCS